MGQRAVCFSQEICVRLKISTAVRTHARTLCANRNRHTTSSSTFCRVSVQSQKASFPGLVPESSPTARQFFCDDTAALPWGEFFFSSFFRTSSARHSVRELDGRAHVESDRRATALDPRLAKGSARTSRTISFSWTCQESSEIPPHYRSGGLISLTCKLGHHGSSRNGGARPDLRNARPSKNRSGSRPRRPSRPRRDNTRSAARAPAAHDARAAILPWCLLRLSAGPLDSISIDWATAKCL